MDYIDVFAFYVLHTAFFSNLVEVSVGPRLTSGAALPHCGKLCFFRSAAVGGRPARAVSARGGEREGDREAVLFVSTHILIDRYCWLISFNH